MSRGVEDLKAGQFENIIYNYSQALSEREHVYLDNLVECLAVTLKLLKVGQSTWVCVEKQKNYPNL